MRAVGTGKHPEGRFPVGQVCDLPEFPIGSGIVHPDYQSLIDSGYLDVLPEEDDPGRTPTQIANAVARGDSLSHPVDAALGEAYSDEKALAVTHTGDPEADEVMADPHEVRGSEVGHRGRQLSAAPQGLTPWAEYDDESERGVSAAGTGNGRKRRSASAKKRSSASSKKRSSKRSSKKRNSAKRASTPRGPESPVSPTTGSPTARPSVGPTGPSSQ